MIVRKSTLSRTIHALRAALAAAAIACTALPAAAATAADVQAAPPPEAAALKKTLEQKFPGARISAITRSPYFGLFEIQFDDQLIYTDAKAKYVLLGSVFDTETRANLTEARLRKLNRVDIANLPLDLAFKRVKGNGQRKLIVFSDADCPYCARLEQELKGIDNVTIYTFLYPIDSLHPDSARKSRMIWCAPDRQKAWDEFFASGALPNNNGDCDTPVEKTHALGEKLRVSATPTLVFADGSIVPGALPVQQLESEMKSAEAETKKPAAAAR
jgi:thiol:disulfide interchange protein DsbC